MRILVVGSEVQQIPSLVFALARMGHDTALYPKPAETLRDDEEEQAEFERFLKEQKVDFVLSNVFTASIARITNRLGMKYAVWCMDSPAYPAWLTEARYDNCYLFFFDRREYELRKKTGCSNVYWLPLGADIDWGEKLVITDEEIKQVGCDMSFVGSLYTKNLYDHIIECFVPEVQNYFTNMIEQSAFVWDGVERMHVPPEIVPVIRQLVPQVFDECADITDEYFLKTYFLDQKLTHVERTLLLELLAEKYDIHLYTRASEKVPEGVRRFPEISAGDAALKVFYASKINLNITLRSISSGLPARVLDVMSVGGFMLTNWQEEIPDLFVEGKEIETYKSPEELIDKADYYLKHDNERQRIGVNGYLKVKKNFTYEQQISKIIAILYPTH